MVCVEEEKGKAAGGEMDRRTDGRTEVGRWRRGGDAVSRRISTACAREQAMVESKFTPVQVLLPPLHVCTQSSCMT